MKEVINYYRRVNGSGHIVEHIDTHESGDYILRQLFSNADKGYRQHKFDFDKEYELIDKSVIAALERQTCPQRNSGIQTMFEKGENLDWWKVMPNGERVCSYCGSIHPMDLLKLLKEGKATITRSDKQYKWYINRPEIDNALKGAIKYYRDHDTKEFIEGYNNWITNLSK